jgi:hypothetical protein
MLVFVLFFVTSWISQCEGGSDCDTTGADNRRGVPAPLVMQMEECENLQYLLMLGVVKAHVSLFAMPDGRAGTDASSCGPVRFHLVNTTKVFEKSSLDSFPPESLLRLGVFSFRLLREAFEAMRLNLDVYDMVTNNCANILYMYPLLGLGYDDRSRDFVARQLVGDEESRRITEEYLLMSPRMSKLGVSLPLDFEGAKKLVDLYQFREQKGGVTTPRQESTDAEVIEIGYFLPVPCIVCDTYADGLDTWTQHIQVS